MNKMMEATGMLLRVSHRHRCMVEQGLAENRIDLYPAQHRILMKLCDMPGISQKELADMLQVSQATVTISIKKLIRSGYVEKNSKETDNRCSVLRITGSGRNIISKSVRVFDNIDEIMFSNFSEDDIDSFKEYLNRIYDNINESILREESDI